MTEVTGMADKFVELEIRKNREEQMRIYATLRCFRTLPLEQQTYIRELCAEIGGLYYGKGLFRFLTTDITLHGAVQRYCVPEGRLRELRKEVYRRWQR